MLLTLACTGTECNVLVSNLPCSYFSLRALQCSVMHCLHRGYLCAMIVYISSSAKPSCGGSAGAGRAWRVGAVILAVLLRGS